MEAIELKVGQKIIIGIKSSEFTGFKENQIIELKEGYFDYDDGLSVDYKKLPSYFDEAKDCYSIYHIFGNDLEYFLDSKIIPQEND